VIGFAVLLFLGVGVYLYSSLSNPETTVSSVQVAGAAGEKKEGGTAGPAEAPEAVRIAGFEGETARGSTEGAEPAATGEPARGAEGGDPALPAVDPEVDMDVFKSEGIKDKSMAIEKDYLFKLLEEVNGSSAEELRSRARTADFTEFFNNPEEWRGKVLRIQGMIRRIVKRRPEKLPAGIEALYEAQLTDKDAYWYYVFLTEKPMYKEDDLVTFNGVFMKVHAYETRKRTRIYAPLLICKNFEKAVLPPWRPFYTIGWAVLVLLVVGGAAAIFISQSQKRDSDAVSRKVEQKRLDRARHWAESRKASGGKPADEVGHAGEKSEDGSEPGKEGEEHSEG
jgi:hypothetical protein